MTMAPKSDNPPWPNCKIISTARTCVSPYLTPSSQVSENPLLTLWPVGPVGCEGHGVSPPTQPTQHRYQKTPPDNLPSMLCRRQSSPAPPTSPTQHWCWWTQTEYHWWRVRPSWSQVKWWAKIKWKWFPDTPMQFYCLSICVIHLTPHCTTPIKMANAS